MKLLSAAAALVALVGIAVVPACSTLNSAAGGLGLDVNYEDVYSNASTIEDRVYLTAGLYEATLDVLIVQCEGANPDSSRQAGCEHALTAAERLSPGVSGLLTSVGVYVAAKADVQAAIEANGAAGPELLAAAATALAELSLKYEDIRTDLRAFIKGPGSA
ncbi:MAG: hypothetical protein CMB99_16560 [Flavobacteriaceae bacterium]|jgi:hypothetical protein|nr:hypothetical protein [Flavobacteriaceae bacterium]|tara:strand:+ start:1210 stop:1692 length:483 start_codon:yes stop_codon:yes gene_type:complete